MNNVTDRPSGMFRVLPGYPAPSLMTVNHP